MSIEISDEALALLLKAVDMIRAETKGARENKAGKVEPASLVCSGPHVWGQGKCTHCHKYQCFWQGTTARCMLVLGHELPHVEGNSHGP